MINALTSIAGWQVYVWILAIILPAAIHLRAARHRDRSRRSEVVLMYILGVSGAIGMFNVVTHTVFASDVAASIGWPAGNPFQTEVGFANFAIGIVGFACFWRYDFWLPAVTAKSVFAWGAGLTHVMDIVRSGNVASNNAGPILAWDFLLPVVIIALYILAQPARDRVAITPALYWSTQWRLDAEDGSRRARAPVPRLREPRWSRPAGPAWPETWAKPGRRPNAHDDCHRQSVMHLTTDTGAPRRPWVHVYE